MYAIEQNFRNVNGRMVPTFLRDVGYGNVELEVEAGTSGCCCESHTCLSLLCLSGGFSFSPIEDEEGHVDGVSIVCHGDDALEAVVKALGFAQKVLNDQRYGVDD